MPVGPQTALRPPKGRIHLRDVVKMLLRASRMGIRTAIPCTVDSYNPITQKATVIAGHITVLNTDNGEREMEPMKVVACPVAFLRGSGGWQTVSLAKGDTGHLICSDRSLENWMNKAPVTDAVDPGARHTHNVIDGIFEPGLHTTTDPIIGAATAGMVLEGIPQIKLGPLALEGAVKDLSLQAFLVTAATTAALSVVPNDGGAAIFTAFITELGKLVAQGAGSTKVRLE